MDNKNSTQEIECQFDKLNVSGYNCFRCNKQFTEELWCKDYDPFRIIEGWTSENSNIDKFIKDTMYDARHEEFPKFLEWVPFNKFTDIKQIGEGGFAKVYSATWIDGPLSKWNNKMMQVGKNQNLDQRQLLEKVKQITKHDG